MKALSFMKKKKKGFDKVLRQTFGKVKVLFVFGSWAEACSNLQTAYLLMLPLESLNKFLNFFFSSAHA